MYINYTYLIYKLHIKSATILSYQQYGGVNDEGFSYLVLLNTI